jgi:hypothetical protein
MQELSFATLAAIRRASSLVNRGPSSSTVPYRVGFDTTKAKLQRGCVIIQLSSSVTFGN